MRSLEQSIDTHYDHVFILNIAKRETIERDWEM